MGIDSGADTTFRANQLFLQDHRVHPENLAGLSEMPPTGGRIITGGIRIRADSGSPATVVRADPAAAPGR
jgi:kynurenine formamidase